MIKCKLGHYVTNAEDLSCSEVKHNLITCRSSNHHIGGVMYD